MSLFMNNRLIVSKQYHRAFWLSKYCIASILFGIYRLLELDEHYPGTRLYEVTDTTDPDFPEKHMAVSFRYRLLDEFLKEWQLRKKQLREGEITKEEYLEWKLNWPQTADGCGRYEPKKKWRKE